MKSPYSKLLLLGCLAATQTVLAVDPQPAPKKTDTKSAHATANVSIQIHSEDGVQEHVTTITPGDNGTIVIGGPNNNVSINGQAMIGATPNGHSIHIKMLQDMADNLPPASKHARENLEKHLMELLSQSDVPKGKNHQVMSFSTASSQTVIDDGEHRIALTSKDGKTELNVATSEGKEIYNGPWNTDADKKNVSPEVREKIDSHQATTQVQVEMQVQEIDGDDINLIIADPALLQNPMPAKKGTNERKRNKPVDLRDDNGRRVY